MPLTLRNPIPVEISKGEVCQGVLVGSQHKFTYWEDGSANVHVITSFGGAYTGYGLDPYTIHHINLDTGVSHLTTCTNGILGKLIYDPVNDRLYCGAGDSFGWLNPTTGAFTIIKNDFAHGMIGDMVYGGDARIYFVIQPFNLYSYKIGEGLVNYGDFSPNAAESNYNGVAVDTTHIYFGVVKQETYNGNMWWTILIGAIGAAKETFVEYAFAAEHDRWVSFIRDYNTKELLLRRTLVDNTTYKYYSFTGGVLTEVTKALNPGYAWNLAGTTIQDLYGPVVLDYPPYCYISASPADKTWFGWEIDAAKLAPLPGSQEYSKLGYRPEIGGAYTYSQKTYTGPWSSSVTLNLTHKSGTDVLLAGAVYGPACTVDYDIPTSISEGYHQFSPYGIITLPNGSVYISGYSGTTLLWDTTAAWTLHSGNMIPYVFGDPNAPNPYKIDIARAGLIHHYRFNMSYDSAGKAWGGANATRALANPGAGNVWWYKPSDGTYGYVFDGTGGKPDWDVAEVYFRSMCHAISRTKMVVAGSNGYLYVVNCADATIDGSYNLGKDDAHMVEVSNDNVVGVTADGYVFRFKPSDRSMIVSPTAIGLGYTPFGWGTSARMSCKLELGPDGYAWLFMGTRIYKIHPTTLAFISVKAVSNYYKLKFIDSAGDQSVYDLMLYGNGKNLMVIPEIFYTPAAADSNPGPELNHFRGIAGGVNAASLGGGRIGNVAGGRV